MVSIINAMALINPTDLVYTNRFARLGNGFSTAVVPQPLAESRLRLVSGAAAALLDLDPAHLFTPAWVDWLSGRRLSSSAEPVAAVYAGHQFGHWVPELGDGRAITLAEVATSSGGWELQLKGAGRTPYSRDGDGRAVIRSSLREYLCSEAMAGLGIPTTRALSLVDSREEVYREQIEWGAVVLRMAPSFIRFGSFEFFSAHRRFELLQQLADFVIDHHYPELKAEPNRYLALLAAVTERTAILVSHWQQVGFCHGVLNSDNMSILGLTLDYGPFGFLDRYDPHHICNHSDYQGRYAYAEQPYIGLWNLSCLAQALLPLLGADRAAAVAEANAILQRYRGQFAAHYYRGMAAKLGLREEQTGDRSLIEELLAQLAESSLDYTQFWRQLARYDEPTSPPLRDHFIDRSRWERWLQNYTERLAQQGLDPTQRRAAMDRVNPIYILRNHLAQQAIVAAEAGDYREAEQLQQVLAHPYEERPEWAAYALPPAAGVEPVVVSCSS